MVCVTIQRGTGGAVADAVIWQNAPSWNDSAGASLTTGTSSAGVRRALIRFGLSSVPAGATVLSASLQLVQLYKASTSTINVHRITVPWVESSVNFTNFGQGYDLTTAGTFTAGTGVGTRTVDLTALAQSWVTGTLVNHGILLDEAPVVNTSFRSSEGTNVADRPRLNLCYVTCSDGIQNGTETGVDCGGATCAPCNVAGSTGTGGAGGTGGDGGSGSGGGGGGGGGSGSGGEGGSGSVFSCGGSTYGCELGSSSAPAMFLYVDGAAPSGGTGSMSAPFTTIQQAFLAVASGRHATICVAEGTYAEHVGNTADTSAQDRRYKFVGGFVRGSGFAVRDCASHPTLVSAPSSSAATFAFGNVKDITIDGFVITGGLHGVRVSSGYSAGRRFSLLHNHIHHNGAGSGPSHNGGGISITSGTVVIQDNLIEDNLSGRLGGGIFVGEAPSSERNTKNVATQTLTVGSSLAT